MSHLNYLIAVSLLLVGCAQTTKPIVLEKPTPVVAPVTQVMPPVVAVTLPGIELTDAILYQYLLTEFANQRGHKALAVEGSEELAQQTRDPRLAKRAAQLALESGDMNRAVAALKLWQETEPSSSMATRMLSQLLLRGGRLDEALIEFIKVIKEDEFNRGAIFLQLYPMMAAYPDKRAILGLMSELARPYPEVAEGHWVVAQLALSAGDSVLALKEVREAARLRPEWDWPVALEAQLLSPAFPEQTLQVLSLFLARYPGASEIRLQYARALLALKQYALAHDEFEKLSLLAPDRVEMAFAVALITMQLKDLPGAEAELKHALEKGGKGQDTVAYFLGQLNEAKENDTQALIYYREVKAGEYQYRAQLRVIDLLHKQGKLLEARQYLQQISGEGEKDKLQLLMIDAQMLRENHQSLEAMQILQEGLKKFPDNEALLYEVAMLADSLGQFDASEKILRHLIYLKPDHAQAYNALGYSLLERNVRINEALVLVEQALRLAPNDPAIMDSVGWGYYRSGKLNESVAMLRSAFLANPDPEIAAHLGEVLWVKGDKAEAIQIWQASLKASPDSAPLQAVMKRYLP